MILTNSSTRQGERKLSPLERGGTLSGSAAAGKVCCALVQLGSCLAGQLSREPGRKNTASACHARIV